MLGFVIPVPRSIVESNQSEHAKIELAYGFLNMIGSMGLAALAVETIKIHKLRNQLESELSTYS